MLLCKTEKKGAPLTGQSPVWLSFHPTKLPRAHYVAGSVLGARIEYEQKYLALSYIQGPQVPCLG